MRDRVARARVATLGTVNAGGGIDLVPVTFALDGDALVTAVDHKPKRTTRLARLDNVRRDPRVTVLVHDYDEDWSRLWWARLRGRARVVEAGTADHTAAVAPLVAKYHQYREQPPAGPAIVVDVEDWRSWSADPGARE